MASMENARHIHLIGIGGCSMSGLARILKAHGHVVTGKRPGADAVYPSLDAAGNPYSIGHTGRIPARRRPGHLFGRHPPGHPERVLAGEPVASRSSSGARRWG